MVHRTRRLGRFAGALAAAAGLAFAGPVTARRTPPTPCPGGRFLVRQGAPLLAGNVAAAADAITIGPGGTVAVAGACTPVAARIRARGKTTHVAARWPPGGCSGVPGAARLVAKLDASCGTLVGKLLAKRVKRKFRAVRSTCGDGTVDTGGRETCEPPGAVGCDASCGAGVGVDGAPDAPLVASVRTFSTRHGVPETEIDREPGGARVARTIVQVAFTPDATVGQATALLEQLQAGVVSMLAGVPVIVLRVPDPGSLAGLDALVARIAAAPGVASAVKGHLSEADATPPNYRSELFPPPAAPPLAKLGHHLGIRAHAAWNARGAILPGKEPTLLVADEFGDGPPADALGATVVPDDFATGILFDHGYFVLGVAAGSFGGDGSDRGLVTGAFPGDGTFFPLPIRAVDRSTRLTDVQTENEIIRLIQESDGPVVVNTSYGLSSVCDPVGLNCRDPAEMETKAVAWITKVRAAGVEGRYVHLTSAGNVDDERPSIASAATNSTFASAALLPGLRAPPAGAPVQNLLNTLVVENARGDGPPGFGPRCVSDRSFVGGQIAGIGTDTWSLDGPDAAVGASFRSATSYATPQVAGLAAYLWSIAPDLTPAEVAGVLRATAREAPDPAGEGCTARAAALPPRRIADAYEAVLSLDTATSPTPGGAPVRLALLDADVDGDFDADDLARFVAAYLEDGAPIPEPAERDFGRFDLNGDGFTGGARGAPFDLDRASSTRLGAPALDPLVLQKLVPAADTRTIFGAFNETAATDLEILCYYAHSELFTGTPAQRTALLPFDRCNRWVFRQNFVTRLNPGTTVPLTVRSGVLQLDGSVAFRPDALIRLTPTNATIGQTDGVTGATGFQTMVTPTVASGEVTIGVEVRLAADGPVIASGTIRAPVGMTTTTVTATTVTTTTGPTSSTTTLPCFCTPPEVCCTPFLCCF